MSFALDMLDRAYNRQSWHGTNLRGSIRGLSLEELSWRPGRGRHNVWEIVVHCAYWKYAVLRRLTGAKRGSFPLEGSNFFARPAGRSGRTSRAWKEDLELLEKTHRALRAAIATLPPSKSLGKSKPAWLIQGIAAHDLYHAGQIQLLKRLQQKR